MLALNSSKTRQIAKSFTEVKSFSIVNVVKSKESALTYEQNSKSNVSLNKTNSISKPVTKSVTKSTNKLASKSKSALKSITLTENQNVSKENTTLLECLPNSVNKKTSNVAAKTKLPKVQVTAMKSRKLVRNRPESRDSVDSFESFKFCTNEGIDDDDDGSPKVKITIIPSNCGRPGKPGKTVQLQKCFDLVKTTCLDQEQPSSIASSVTNSQIAFGANSNNNFEIVNAVDMDLKSAAKQVLNKTEIQTNTGQGKQANALQSTTERPPSSEPTQSMQLVGKMACWSRITALLIVVFGVAAIIVGLILSKKN